LNIISIDPGFSGAIGYLWERGQYGVYDAPVTRVDGRNEFLVSAMVMKINACLPPLWASQQNVCVIEKVGSRPGEGSVSSFRFGYGVGLWVGICAALAIPVVFVSPAKWKKQLGLGKDKELSLILARELFPGVSLKRKKDDGRAEALLIGYWYRDQLSKG
jgi:crossover junction endodeoxyribonuclease RuvC